MSAFVNPADGRPRAGWRLLIQFVLMIMLLSMWQIIAGSLQPGGLTQGNSAIVIGGIFVFWSIWIAAYLLDQRKLREYGLRLSSQWWRELILGISIGAVGMAAIYAVFHLSGWIEFTGWGWRRSQQAGYIQAIGGYFLAMAAVGFYEELLARGYQTKNIAEGLRYRFDSGPAAIIAVLASSLVFGLLHLGNPHTGWLSTINITMAGVMLGLPYILGHSLAIPIGLHFSWNFFQGGVFGLPVSGNPARESIIQVSVDGPDLLTGGAFGPEGGVIATCVILALIGFILYYYQKTNGSLQVNATFTDAPEFLQPVEPGSSENSKNYPM